MSGRDIPIIFSGPMVRALLEGRKTMTRRLAHSTSRDGIESLRPSPWQKVKPGDRLWVRENVTRFDKGSCDQHVWYWADQGKYTLADGPAGGEPYSVPCIHMPRWASRLTLIVTKAKIEPLHAISRADADAEGIESFFDGGTKFWKRYRDGGWNGYVDCPINSYASLWTELHGPGSWEVNPVVVALTFQVHKQNIASVPLSVAGERP